MRSKDRLAELRQLTRGATATAAPGDAVYCGTTEPPTPPTPPTLDQDLQDILDEAERTRGWIDEVARSTQLARRLHADPTYHTSRHLQEQLEAAVTRSHALGLKVCGALRQLEARALRAGAAPSDTRARVARLQYAAARALYADALADQHRLLQVVRDSQLHLLHHQIKLTNLTISDEECQSLLDSKNISLFVDNVGAQTAEALRGLREAEARRKELARVEEALRDVRDLFAQLAHLVAQQQDTLDSVEYFALAAGDHVDGGQRQLQAGSVTRTKARKKKLSLIVCLVSGFLVVLLVLIIT